MKTSSVLGSIKIQRHQIKYSMILNIPSPFPPKYTKKLLISKEQ